MEAKGLIWYGFHISHTSVCVDSFTNPAQFERD